MLPVLLCEPGLLSNSFPPVAKYGYWGQKHEIVANHRGTGRKRLASYAAIRGTVWAWLRKWHSLPKVLS